MAECLELLNPAGLEEQQEELTVLQSIFEDDLQMLQGENGQANISFNLTVKVNIPFERIDFEAFIPIPGEVDSFDGRSAIKSSSDSGDECGTDRKKGEENSATTEYESHLDVQENGMEASASSIKNETENYSETSPNGFAGRGKPGFSRSLSQRHWHVRADIQYLTPMQLTCTFPPLYPTECPPEFALSCLWLTRNQIQILQEQLMSLWTENPSLPIVYTWADWLQNYAYEYLRLGSHLVLKNTDGNQELKQNEGFGTKLQTALLTIFEYDLEMQRQAFQQSTHECEICFDKRDGTEFHYLDECKHFFCNDCLKAHCELHVEGGTVLNLLCPNHECKTMIPPEILRDVLDAEKLDRWERLLLSKTLDIMGDVVYCPRCNVAVVADEDESSRLAHCANCFFAFCTECLEPWHARQQCIEEESDSEDEEDGENKNPRSKKKKEKGKEEGAMKAELSLRRQQKLQRERERKKELSNLSFIRLMKQQGNYQYCPKCRMAVERISGCDMMHCSQCRAQFCWRCGKAISGYDHFGNCGREIRAPHPPPREPTVGETLIEEYRKAHPRKTLRTKFCPRCHQKCLKENSNNNHLKCWACKTDFCYQCGKEIKGAVTVHFTAASSCTQHSDD